MCFQICFMSLQILKHPKLNVTCALSGKCTKYNIVTKICVERGEFV